MFLELFGFFALIFFLLLLMLYAKAASKNTLETVRQRPTLFFVILMATALLWALPVAWYANKGETFLEPVLTFILIIIFTLTAAVIPFALIKSGKEIRDEQAREDSLPKKGAIWMFGLGRLIVPLALLFVFLLIFVLIYVCSIWGTSSACIWFFDRF